MQRTMSASAALTGSERGQLHIAGFQVTDSTGEPEQAVAGMLEQHEERSRDVRPNAAEDCQRQRSIQRDQPRLAGGLTLLQVPLNG